MDGIDELNSANENWVVPIEEYFEEIKEITKEDRKKREEFAFEMKDALLFIFSLYLIMKKYNYVNRNFIELNLERKYLEIASKYSKIDTELKEYIKRFSGEIVEVTIKNGDTEYFTSDDRATIISENESQNTLNRKDYKDALKSGKKKKQWVDIRDGRERETHRVVGGTIIPIDEYFRVGNSMLLFPHDQSMDPEAKEVVNCRCSIRYI